MTPVPSSPKIAIKRIAKSYGPVRALRETDLEIHHGEFLTLLGPSGSGKTTLLSMIAGLILPDSGEIWIGGRDVSLAPPEKRDVGMVFQNYALFPHMTVGENIAFPLRMRKQDQRAIEREVARALDVVRLPEVASRYPHELSGGQQQRIALARCMVYRPSVILMDEPLGALDKKLREQMQAEIRRLHTELAITVVYVTHDQEEALVLSDRICLMNNAGIEQIGTASDLYLRPRSLFAADFLGESNIFDAVVVEMANAGETTVSSQNGAFRCGGGAAWPKGSAVKMIVRPECVSILEAGEKADNEIVAALSEVTLVGSITKYIAQLADGRPVLASALTRPGQVPPQIGSSLRLGWAATAAVLVPSAGGRS